MLIGILAGAAKVDITPPIGVYLDGYAKRKGPSQGIHDNLFARALYITDGNTSLAIVACDLCWVSQHLVEATHEVLHQKSANIDHVILCAIHTHSGPAIVDLLTPLNEWNLRYLGELPVRLADAILIAMKKAEPASLQVAKGEVDLSINRRESHGQVDSEVITVSVMNTDCNPIAEIVNYGCHGTVLGHDNLLVSADYPGVLAASIESSHGGGLVCLFTNGACGDVNPRTSKGYRSAGDFEDVETIGSSLANCSILSKETGKETGTVDTSGGIHYRSVMLGPLPPLGIEIELCAIGVGNLVMLAVPGEIFAETGLALKNKCGSENVLIIGYANGYQGYFPTEDAFLRNDYETSSLCWVTASAERELRRTGVKISTEFLKEQKPGFKP